MAQFVVLLPAALRTLFTKHPFVFAVMMASLSSEFPGNILNWIYFTKEVGVEVRVDLENWTASSRLVKPRVEDR